MRIVANIVIFPVETTHKISEMSKETAKEIKRARSSLQFEKGRGGECKYLWMRSILHIWYFK